MELDGLAAETAAIERFEPWRMCIGLPAPLEHLGRAPAAPESCKNLALGAARIARDRIPQRQVAAEQVHVLIRRRLVGKLGLRRGHRMPSYPALRRPPPVWRSR